MSHENLNGNENEPQESAPAPSVTPPTQAGPLAKPALYGPGGSVPPVWPTVIGVIAAVLGSLDVLGGIWAVLSPVLLKTLLANVAANPNMPQFDAQWAVISGVVAIALGIFLIIVGAGIAKRASWSPKAARTWSIVKIVYVLAGVIIGFSMQQQAASAATQTSGPGMVVSTNAIMIPGLCLGLVWGWALPVFLLIWFGRASVKEQVSKWS